MRLLSLLLVLAAPATASAYYVQTRFVDPDNGNAPYPNLVDALTGRDYRVRVQVGVFGDGEGDGRGGVLGWNFGRLDSVHGTMRRSPGRLAPFVFSPAPPGNGLPAVDPFHTLTEIDATIGLQPMMWLPGHDQPTPVIRGYESWVSVFEFTVPIAPDQRAGFDIRLRGQVPVAFGWFEMSTPIPPDGDEPGSVLYAPMVLTNERIDRTIEFRVVPAPAPAALLVLTTLLPRARRRAVTAAARARAAGSPTAPAPNRRRTPR